MQTIRAKIVSLGGGILLSVCLVLGALTAAAFSSTDFSSIQRSLVLLLLAATGLYLVDSWSEWLGFDGQRVTFDSWFKRRRTLDLNGVSQILYVHEGLNLDLGIESIEFRRPDGDAVRFALGPLWHRRDLEAFLGAIERRTGRAKMVEEVR